MLKISCFLLFCLLINPAPNYKKIFGSSYTDALNYFTKNRIVIQAHFDYHSVDNELIIPAIFPERIRYSMVKDLIETAAVEIIYIDLGAEYVDFSIGDFQIKPSFAEKVETFISELPHLKLKYKLLTGYKLKKNRDERKERIRRLKSLNFQLIYISAFYDIVIHNFNLDDKSKIEKIRFLASAYNHGVDADELSISKYASKKCFPYGVKYKGKQYSYSNVAVDFYLKQYKMIFK